MSPLLAAAFLVALTVLAWVPLTPLLFGPDPSRHTSRPIPVPVVLDAFPVTTTDWTGLV